MKRNKRNFLTFKPWLLYNDNDLDDSGGGGGGSGDTDDESSKKKVSGPSENEVKLANALKEANDRLKAMEAKIEAAEQEVIDKTSKDELDKANKTIARLEAEKKKNEEEAAKLKQKVALQDRNDLLRKYFKEQASKDEPKRYDETLVFKLLGNDIPESVEVALANLETEFPRIVITEKDNHPPRSHSKKSEKEQTGFQLADDILKQHGNGGLDFAENFKKQNESLSKR